MATIYTAQAIRRNDHHQVSKVSGAAYNPGDVVINCVGDGRVGVVAGLEAVASGDPVTFYVEGKYEVACASATTFSAGDLVYWDDANNTAKTTAGVAGTSDWKLLGRAVKAKTSGQLVVLVEINLPVRFVGGEVTLDGTNPTSVVTGLTKVLGASASLKSATAPGDDPSWLSVNYAGDDAQLDIYAWKNTGGSDPTLVASTNSSAVISWIAWGV